MRDHRLAPLRQGYQALKRLTLFLAYARLDASGQNPNWATMAFTPPPPPPPSPPRFHPISPDGETTLAADVLVVGSGAAGGVVAATLAGAGHDVLIVEQGEYLDRADFIGREADMMPRLYLGGGVLATDDLEVMLLAGGALGGGTVVNWMASLRAPADVVQEWATLTGMAEFASSPMQEACAHVEGRLSVGVGESPDNPNNAALLRGLDALGLPAARIPRNVRGCEGRCGACGYGCPHGGKQSVLETFLLDATKAGARLLVGTAVRSVCLKGGRVEGVDATWTAPDGTRKDVFIRAGKVVLCAGALNTPAILLRSGIASPWLGRGIYLHPTTALSARYAQPIRSWEGAPMSVLSHAFAGRNGGYGFYLETAPGHPGLIALAAPWDGADTHRSFMNDAAHMADFIVLARDRQGGRIRVRRDGAQLTYRLGDDTLRMLKEGLATLARVAFAGGGRRR